MKITRVEGIPVCVPLKKGMTTRTAHGEHTISSYVVLRLHTDAGIVGLGEATLAPRWSGETQRSCLAAIDELLTPALIGQDPRHITALRLSLERELKLNPFTRAAVEMALWDIAGKAVGRPVYELLGGKVRERVPIKMVIGAFDVQRAVTLADLFLTWGVQSLKVKVGLDPHEDVERVRAVRERAGAKVSLGIDANGGWNGPVARRTLERLQAYDLLFVEQPVPPGPLQPLVELRQRFSIPLMADESVFTAANAWHLAREGAADILSVYPGKQGGIAACMEMGHLAQAAGLVCALGSNLELGIATAAMLHVAVALPSMVSEMFPADAIGPLYHEVDLLREPLALGPVYATVPEGPGLGVELDEEQLSRYRI